MMIVAPADLFAVHHVGDQLRADRIIGFFDHTIPIVAGDVGVEMLGVYSKFVVLHRDQLPIGMGPKSVTEEKLGALLAKEAA